MDFKNDSNHFMFYNEPAKDWSESLPIGNGRLGAMVHGRYQTEVLQLNENSVVYGGSQDRMPRDALKNLGRLRQLIRAGNHIEAEKLVQLAFFATPHSQRSYEPLATVSIEFGHTNVKHYRRSLDLRTAITETKYTLANGVTHLRQAYASHADNVLVMHVESSERISFTLRLTRKGEHEFETDEFVDSIEGGDGRIIMNATPGGRNSNHLCCAAAVTCEDKEGSVCAIGSCLVVNSAKATILFAAHTTFRFEDPEAVAIQNIENAKKVLDLKYRHIEDYRSLYERMELRLSSIQVDLPTNLRLQNLLHTPDTGLVVLYQNYGRYLLICCSRPGHKALPANLQGLWNPSFQPAWGSKYTININTQMNYWPANLCNLSDCEVPLFDLLQRVAENGRKTAAGMYGCRGWAAHHNTDVWGDTDPQDRWMPATLWPLGGAWLCIHILESYLFNRNQEFLKKLFPIYRECVRFLLDFLIYDSTGQYLVTCPSLSPENSFVIPGSDQQGTLCEGSTIDIQIIDALFDGFENLVSLADRNTNDELLPHVIEARQRLPQMKIGRFGQIQEWQEDYEEVEPGHRHTSHLWALYPGSKITPRKDAALATASKQVLERRAAHGGGHTGWSRAWLINLHARLGDSVGCLDHVIKLLTQSTMPNLLDTHPPFQIDGNFGGCAGIIEMLIQSHDDCISLLPACPQSWSSGSLRGVCVRGNMTVDFAWVNNKIHGPVIIRRKNWDGVNDEVIDGKLMFPDGHEIGFSCQSVLELYR
ncbi:alpha-l-fucosidase [Phlyctema vagabunda]|uniref:Alpha-l-fucosidase n=1 Tax=Phlyctema vagabunda TaxID=108571 RepID=A0ABR4PX80_9HELO